MRITLGQKVRKARIPQATGFGFGSFVRPSLATVGGRGVDLLLERRLAHLRLRSLTSPLAR
jgi:hypothetical protein